MIDEMTSDYARNYLQTLFANAGKARVPKYKNIPNEQLNPRQLEYLSGIGVQYFKRRAMGFWKNSTVKTLDEFAALLIDTHICPNSEQAKEIVPRMVQANKLANLARSPVLGSERSLWFKEIENTSGLVEQYFIGAGNFD